MLLIDGDIIAYRSCFANKEGDFEDVCKSIDDLMYLILNANLFYHDPKTYKVYLTGEGNFRNEIDPEYKANRKGSAKPEYLMEAMGYLIDEYKAEVSYGEEADDLIAQEACRLGYESIIASIDKDFLQVPGRHYNFYHYKKSQVSESEGYYSFCRQLLTGDAADNIKGLSGIGPKKAERILKEGAQSKGGSGVPTYDALISKVIAAYRKHGEPESNLVKNGRLLWLRRRKGETWDYNTRH